MTDEELDQKLGDIAFGGDPDLIVQHQDLGQAEKRALLRRWHARVGAAGDPELAQRIARALAFVDGDTGIADHVRIDGTPD